MLAMGSSKAGAQVANVNYDLKSAVHSVNLDAAAKPLGAATPNSAATMVTQAIVRTTSAVRLGNGSIVQAAPAQSVTLKLGASIASEASWLYHAGWPLYALVERYATNAQLDQESNCLATAVYFEARGESVDGQLAVARVVMNRAASGRYPPDWCSVVKQPWQFSFVRHGEFPSIDMGSSAWARAQGVARIAIANVVPSLQPDVLWYHATYVAPSWGHRLNMVEKIGAHIFYRA